jgi:hypothetical protein
MAVNNPHVERSVITTTINNNGTQSVESVVFPSSTPATTAKIDEIIALATSICGEIPVLPWTGNLLGMTGYMDRFEHEDMSSPVMQGQDSDGRKFLAIRNICTCDASITGGPDEIEKYVVAVHQRYPGEELCVFAGGDGSPTVWDETEEGVVEWFTRLLNSEVVSRHFSPMNGETFKLA